MNKQSWPIKGSNQQVAQEANLSGRKSPAQMFLLCGDFIYSLFIVWGLDLPICYILLHGTFTALNSLTSSIFRRAKNLIETI